jgi:hypothetical protein
MWHVTEKIVKVFDLSNWKNGTTISQQWRVLGGTNLEQKNSVHLVWT